MNDIVAALVLDLVEWVAKSPRTYAEVMEAWRTSCPRLTVWEDAVEGGYVERRSAGGSEGDVVITAKGMALLERNGRHPSCDRPPLRAPMAA